MKRTFKIDLDKERKGSIRDLTIWSLVGFFLFLLIANLISAFIIAGVMFLFVLLQYKLMSKYFIIEYELSADKLKLIYSENGTKKTIELNKGEFIAEKAYTVLYAPRPGKKLTISWKNGSIHQYWIGDWNEYKMNELIEANK